MTSADPNKGAMSLPLEGIQRKIVVLRGVPVMFDTDLANLYGVETKKLIQAVKRNPHRFSAKFMFQLNEEEFAVLRSHFVTSNNEMPAQSEILKSQIVTSSGRGGRRYLPYAFTERGVVMLSSVLRSDRAVAVSIQVVDAFVELSHLLSSSDEIFKRLHELEMKYTSHDDKIHAIFDAIRNLMEPPKKPTRRIGFAPPEDDDV